MSTSNNSTKSATTTGIVAALAASSCCIPPVIAAIAGIGGISSGLSWVEPLRPYLIGLAVIAIGYAWYAHLKPKKEEDCCVSDNKPKWYQTKGFLMGITIFAAVSIAFPYYSGIFFPGNTANKTIVVKENDLTETELTIEGMTCAGCEHQVTQALNNSPGVVEASSSYKTGTATVKFDKTLVSIDELVNSVEEETGYKVVGKQ
ncbi:mercuric transport protein MerTP [Salegentibacter sp. JZCK2]|uniref:mercuric transport protein MerTP n=1 Tax=Salegentibacter tibetensis TaxID=2873600 RepID=UPI001CC97EE3|nr:mercuric transport protein MerTP [Salegentibacter tibetensis]MBZ9731528.1 mercuric transport protein MerTP [Salegentibacter tibetensis]